ncbi:hypothetical protein [Halarcobacter bivalviorum]|uniref:Lipoprotein n=1 Tax=Halarcobacter bivalviorum TaxID=663364 RepID=A0AAX2ADL2_9BACT|nr:hypothetical protein [Halarcobacter bivalviorum]AXH11658.1 hypothetical protein ABIV_0645 [Halarcobacter bivalviorum]RXK10791.1 hypothetical protein CRV05_00010 [Halarcobacter bivalviorum]
MGFKSFLLIILFTLFFTGCMPKQDDVKNVFQSDSANIIKRDYQKSQKLLISFKQKLDKRNPKAYDKALEQKIYDLIINSEKTLHLKYKNRILENYKDYLQLAFSKDFISARNDYLILGLYYSLYEAYDIKSGHKIIALEYEKEKLHKLHKNLQILKWKIKVDRDLNNEYLFLTWQNNWQIELEKKLNNNEEISYDDIKNLAFIKNGKENLLSRSNFTFEVILTQMIYNVENSLYALGEEPKKLALDAVFFLFI